MNRGIIIKGRNFVSVRIDRCIDLGRHLKTNHRCRMRQFLARQRRTAFQGFGAAFVGQFKMRKPTACEIEHAVDTPVRACATGFADAGAIGETQCAAGPAQPGARRLYLQQPTDNGGEERHRLFQPVMHTGIAEFDDVQQRQCRQAPAWRRASLLRCAAMGTIDLRSDTVTRPTAEMRCAPLSTRP